MFSGRLGGTMTAGRALLTLALATIVSLALALALNDAQRSSAQEPAQALEPAEPSFGIDWAYRPDDLGELSDVSPAVLLAEVEAVRDGEPMIAPPADGEGQGEPLVLPTERIDLQVIEAIEGQTPASFTLFKLGAGGEQPSGDPAYSLGERYLLFIRRRLDDAGTAPNPDGTFIAVAPDGRLAQEPASGELEPLIEGEVAAELDGLSVPEAERAIEEASSP